MTISRDPLNRRTVVLSLVAAPLVGCSPGLPNQRPARAALELPDFSMIEAATRGRIGIAALDLGNGRMFGHRQNERFAMCSSFKWLLAGLVLQRVDRGAEQLDRRIGYTQADLVLNSPTTTKNLGSGMTTGELCAATVGVSDNAAANLLIATFGGPAGVTAAIRGIGDAVTRLDRTEPALNENAPGDPRDTSTPAAMVAIMRALLFGNVLMPASRALLQRWMIDASTGLDRLRAGFPAGWVAGDKTGTSDTNQNNDVAFAMPSAGSGRAPVLIVSFLNIPNAVGKSANAHHGDIARAVSRAFAIS